MRALQVYCFVAFALLTIIASVLCFHDVWIPLERYKVVFYYSQPCAVLLAFLIVPCGLAITLLQFRRLSRKPTPGRKRFLLLLSTFLFVSANGIVCGALPALLNRYNTLSEIDLAGHLYRLDVTYSGTLSDFNDLLLLWECDNAGLFCRVIYTRDYYSDMSLRLKSDFKTNTLQFVINDKIAYTHRP